jgi:hypothetical protein
MPSVRPLVKKFNTDEFYANRFITFETDANDEWTVDNFQGTNYQIITDANNTPDIEGKYLKGLDEIRFNVALGSAYEDLNKIEKFLKKVAELIDDGTGGDLVSKFQEKIQCLKQSNNWHTVPKIIKLENGRLPTNYRDVFSAKSLYQDYINEKSFVTNNNTTGAINNWHGQKINYEGVRVHFTMDNFISLITNSYFTDWQGKSAKAVKIEWFPSKDFAVIDYWVREKYDGNLKETFIEPGNPASSDEL